MGIQVFESEDDMDDAFEASMELMQEEARLKDAIGYQEEVVAQATTELEEAQAELQSLHDQLEQLGV